MRELHPGKELFIDDFFIESLHGARRVLQQPEKMTVDQPLELPFEKAWERGAVWPGQVVYDEHNRIFRLYYNAATSSGDSETAFRVFDDAFGPEYMCIE